MCCCGSKLWGHSSQSGPILACLFAHRILTSVAAVDVPLGGKGIRSGPMIAAFSSVKVFLHVFLSQGGRHVSNTMPIEYPCYQLALCLNDIYGIRLPITSLEQSLETSKLSGDPNLLATFVPALPATVKAYASPWLGNEFEVSLIRLGVGPWRRQASRAF